MNKQWALNTTEHGYVLIIEGEVFGIYDVLEDAVFDLNEELGVSNEKR
jgi:hypothetical protein